MDATTAAKFEIVLKQSELLEGQFNQLLANICDGRSDGPERLAEILSAHQALRTADRDLYHTEMSYPEEFPVFAEAWHAARSGNRAAANLTRGADAILSSPLS